MGHPNTFDKKASKGVIWSIYLIIILEMLYMSTPFAVFFYSIYGMPLKLLSQHNATLWLTQTILPHFTQTRSVLINTLLFISWPLMGVGLLVFVIGFCQVYWAKFRRKGPVVGGLYRFVRHPQYAGWALFGLGMALFWSRMIVWITYVTMLFVYCLLAINEERACLRKYGESYRSYLRKTGRFLPSIRKEKNVQPRSPLHQKRPMPVAAFALLYVMALLGTVSLGFFMRSHVLSAVSMIREKDTAVVSLIPMDPDRMQNITAIALMGKIATERLAAPPKPLPRKRLIYIMPEPWHVSELAMAPATDRGHRHGFNPTTHGNPTAVENKRYKVLISEALVNEEVEGKEILSKARGQIPLLIVTLDLETKGITSIENPPLHGKYGDIPVPLF